MLKTVAVSRSTIKTNGEAYSARNAREASAPASGFALATAGGIIVSYIEAMVFNVGV